MTEILPRVALVTGASRGIGAEVARRLAAAGVAVALNYRSKAHRAAAVAAEIRAAGGSALVVQADLTIEAEVAAMLGAVGAAFGRLDLLVLNASGGLEKDRPADYALQLNSVAQSRVVDAALPLMPSGGRIVFVTSHLAHFYAARPGYAAYEAVAASKYAGEQALRARVLELAERGVQLVVVSGDLIEGTITPRLMDRGERGLIEARRAQTGALPTVADFAQVIADACVDPALASGATLFVGSTDW